jgi:formylglycine-generating enzyme required for sulfatase activity
VEFAFVTISPGVFKMGSDQGNADEQPPHQVTISRGFQMGKYEVTVRQFRVFAERSGYQTDAEKQAQGFTLTAEGWNETPGASWRNPGFSVNEEDPVVLVSWHDAMEFCAWLSREDKRHQYRLPTAAEWEYAARAGTSGEYAGDVDEMGWYGNNAGQTRLDVDVIWEQDRTNHSKRIFENGNRPHRVGQKTPNAWGLYDMHGNVWEWVGDWYDEDYYLNSSSTDPQGPGSGAVRTLRGGSWFDSPKNLRSAVRHWPVGGHLMAVEGFRLVRLPTPPSL